MAIRIWGEEDNDDVCLRLVKRGENVRLIDCYEDGESRFVLATISRKGIYLWTQLGAGLGISTEGPGRIRVLDKHQV